jgi:hypothetical protein
MGAGLWRGSVVLRPGDQIEEGFLLTFNALNLFKTPKLHLVAQVASFGGMR